jgi:hypothetical protein
VIQVVFMGDDWFGNGPRQAPEEARSTPLERLRIHSALFRFVDRQLAAILKSRQQYEIHRRIPTADFADRMNTVVSLLEQSRAIARQNGAGFLVVLCPRYSQVYDNAWNTARLVYRLADNEYTPLEPDHLFAERLRAHGFWTVDLLGPLHREAYRRPLHYPIDGHWNRAGNDFVASVLSRRVAKWLDREAHVGG